MVKTENRAKLDIAKLCNRVAIDASQLSNYILDSRISGAVRNAQQTLDAMKKVVSALEKYKKTFG